MKNLILSAVLASVSLFGNAQTTTSQTTHYTPTEENLKAREQFSDSRFGIFLHWGLYSMFAQGEWYLNYGPDKDEYAKAADAF